MLYLPDGRRFETYVELLERAEQEAARAEQAQLLAEQERTRAEAEHVRAEQAQRLAEQERARAERMAARLRELGIDPA